MPENLQRVKFRAHQLSPEDRLELWRYIAELPDSRINKVVSSAAPLFPLDIATSREEQQANPDVQDFKRECRIENGQAVIYFDDAEIMRVIFHPTSYANMFFEKLKANADFLQMSGEQRQRLIDQFREAVYAETGTRLSDDAILAVEPEALRQLGLALLKESVEFSADQISQNLPYAAIMVFDKIIQALAFAGANQLRDVFELPEGKYDAKTIKEALFQEEWEHVKKIIGISQGGAHNIKHQWTDEERACLASNFDRLSPIWLEAKRIAVAAQKSREATRRRRWMEEVLGTYPELPKELLARLSTPRSADAKPTDIAVLHAAQECIPASYSVSTLRKVVSAWKSNPQK